MKSPGFRFMLLATWPAVCQSLPAAVTIVDSFDQGGFTMSFPDDINPSDETVDLPLALRREASFGALTTTPGTQMVAGMDPSSLIFVVAGSSPFPNVRLSLQIVYSGGGPYDISDCTGFILGFSQLAGVGSLYVELGSSSEPTGINRIDLTGPGDVYYPVADVRLNGIHTLDSFNVLRFIFEAESTVFSFTIEEIRLVPEPSVAMMALAAGVWCLGLRRRT
jgi:hypothetical protein